MYKYPNTTILVFCKAPIAGTVKTRLMPHLNGQAAADIHIELSQRTLALLLKAQLCPIQLWCYPDKEHSFFNDCVVKYNVTLYEQKGSDLGERMLFAITHALQQSPRVLLLGCDSPSLIAKDLDLAISSLQTQQDIVVAPAEDGGYVMIGMKQAYPELFLNMKWGHNRVLSHTHEKIKQLGLNVTETKQQWDVDDINDLNRYKNSE